MKIGPFIGGGRNERDSLWEEGLFRRNGGHRDLVGKILLTKIGEMVARRMNSEGSTYESGSNERSEIGGSNVIAESESSFSEKGTIKVS
jgi:hypothetical protein